MDNKHERLLTLHTTIVEERKKLHREKKKILKQKKKMEKQQTKYNTNASVSSNGSNSSSSSSSIGDNDTEYNDMTHQMQLQYGMQPMDFMAAHKGSINSLQIPNQLHYNNASSSSSSSSSSSVTMRPMLSNANTGRRWDNNVNEVDDASEYAETIISEDATELQSVNSLSDGEMEDVMKTKRRDIQHLRVPYE